MPQHDQTFTLIINAGGQSRRMGSPKANLVLPTTGAILVWHVASRLASLPIAQLVVVTNTPLAAPPAMDAIISIVGDRFPGAGALGGIATGLHAAPEWGIVVACDMPLVRPSLFTVLCALAAEQDADGRDRWDAVVPVVGGRVQTMHALYHRRCLPAIEARLAVDQLRIADFLQDVRVRWVSEEELRLNDPELTAFFNVNTPADWQAVLAQLDEPQSPATA